MGNQKHETISLFKTNTQGIGCSKMFKSSKTTIHTKTQSDSVDIKILVTKLLSESATTRARTE